MNKIAALRKLVDKKLDKQNCAELKYTGNKNIGDTDFYLTTSPNRNDWALYQGCELIIGDTTFENCANILLNLAK